MEHVWVLERFLPKQPHFWIENSILVRNSLFDLMLCEMRVQQKGRPWGWAFLKIFEISWTPVKSSLQGFPWAEGDPQWFCIRVFCTVTVYKLTYYSLQKYVYIKLDLQHFNPHSLLKIRMLFWGKGTGHSPSPSVLPMSFSNWVGLASLWHLRKNKWSGV